MEIRQLGFLFFILFYLAKFSPVVEQLNPDNRTRNSEMNGAMEIVFPLIIKLP
jgi:hypothetical protein